MTKDFKVTTYIVDDNLADTFCWLCQHQDSFDSFSYDVQTGELIVNHAAGSDVIRKGNYLNASYGVLLTSS
ncbi:hypothetical protein KTI59_01210 [Acinetobacter radioresistens]|uniref:hypothetical protein n=1 Tax=Acinetobacter radioresistens TaxID=40216 RepID=UPI0021CDCFD4|nr:hypothetical protein [Acinetobacter radioresistens]MCU4498744.1 hypothetical protein [Acinetobacter radioresistens]